LSWAAGIHQTAIGRIEKGERKPTLGTIFKLAHGLGFRLPSCSPGSTERRERNSRHKTRQF
jgi:transcriptional regulator with XRE-family HTH domain